VKVYLSNVGLLHGTSLPAGRTAGSCVYLMLSLCGAQFRHAALLQSIVIKPWLRAK